MAGVFGELAAGFRFDSREVALLARACSTADAIDALEQVVTADGPTARGSRGQVVVHPALAELRQQKLVLLRLLSAIDFGNDQDGETPASRRARHAAETRWNRRDRRTQRRAP